MGRSTLRVKENIRQALGDDLLRAAVRKATATAVDSRQRVMEVTPYWELLRRRLHGYKKEVIEHLDEYLEIFEARCLKNGIQVHWAVDAAEARGIILDLAGKNSVRKVVKSKSLTTEEIKLNRALAGAGIEAVETDLGEYIVQLEGEVPSHLIMPAMHLSRRDIGRLFQKKLGIPYTDEPTELLTVARNTLRRHFLSADMGISGVNFAVAGEGCFVIVENEANAHLTITLPRVHVGVMGIEKLIPSLESLPYFLKILAPSATGQKSSTYVNIVGGPQRRRYGEGPEEVHLVLLDNGRSRILRDPRLREVLFCIRCGACLNICPVFRQIGGHAYGWVYMGPIGATLIPQFLGEAEGRHAPFMSSLCCACFEICPVRINIPDHLLTLRNRVVEAGKSGTIERIVMKSWAFLARHPRLYRLATWFPGRLQRLLPKGKAIPAPGFTGERSPGRFDAKGFRKRYYGEFSEQEKDSGSDIGRKR